MRVIVTGLVATYPVGGVAWDYLQYVQAFHALGCDVHYLEDTGQWVYDPAAQTFTDDVSANARYLAAALASLDPGLERRWTVRGPDGRLHGLDERELAALCAKTDLFLNVSGSCWLREPYRAARVEAYVDTDPCYSQARIAAVAHPGDARGGARGRRAPGADRGRRLAAARRPRRVGDDGRLPRLHPRLARRAVDRQERLRGDAERLVQHAQRGVPGVRETRGR